MPTDIVDDILDQWSHERPDLDTDSLGVVIRVMTLYRSFLREATDALEPLGLELWEYDVLGATATGPTFCPSCNRASE